MKEKRQVRERRKRERRVKDISVPYERRSGLDRRWALRRDSDIAADIRRMLQKIRNAQKKKKSVHRKSRRRERRS